MPAFFIFFAIAGGVVAAVFGARHQKDRRDAQWRKAAAELGLKVSTSTWGYPSIAGYAGGCAVHVDVKKSGGDNNSVRTHYRVMYPPLGLGLKLRPENFAAKIGRFFGGQDLEVGNEEFDSTFIIKSSDPNRLREFLTPSRQLTLLRLVAAYPSIEVDDDGVRLVGHGASQSASTIVSIVRRLISTARQLTEEAGWSETIATQSEGNLGEAAAQLRARVRPHPDDFDTPMYEVEVLHSAGDDDGARGILEDLSARLPDDPEVAGWRDRLQPAAAGPNAGPATRPESVPHSESEPMPIQSAPDATTYEAAPPLTEPAKPEWAPDAVELAQNLFGTRRMSFETDKLFQDEFAGKKVAWTGKVRRVTPYERDYDFGDTAGTKVVMTIASISNDLYGQTTIDAVVQLPAEATARLDHGSTIQVTGTLSRVDSLMRNVYITNGTLS